MRRVGAFRRRRPVRGAGLGTALVGLVALGPLAGCAAGDDEPTATLSAYAELVGPTGPVEARPVPDGRSTVRAVPPGATALPVPQPAPPSSPGPSSSLDATPSAGTTPAGPVFRGAVWTISDAVAARMSASWRPGCPVPLEDLRYVTVTYRDFAGEAHQGELVVHADVAAGVVGVFRTLFDARYPIASMRLVDDFGGSDDDSMAADNTSAFNCRAITGGTSWSEHAYGRAIDLNPVENPYVRASGRAAPREGQQFADRHEAPGVIQPDDVVVRAFAAAGWQWGGTWDYPIDYQHFSTTGR